MYINHPDILDFSKPSFYNYVNNGVFEFKPLDFPRIVKYKKRKNSNKRRTRKEREILIAYYIDGRTAEDIGNNLYFQLFNQTRSNRHIQRIIEKATNKMLNL